MQLEPTNFEKIVPVARGRCEVTPSVLPRVVGASILRSLARHRLEYMKCDVQNGEFCSVSGSLLDVPTMATSEQFSNSMRWGREQLSVPGRCSLASLRFQKCQPCPSMTPPPVIVMFVAPTAPTTAPYRQVLFAISREPTYLIPRAFDYANGSTVATTSFCEERTWRRARRRRGSALTMGNWRRQGSLQLSD